jgi:hypothetical protein
MLTLASTQKDSYNQQEFPQYNVMIDLCPYIQLTLHDTCILDDFLNQEQKPSLIEVAMKIDGMLRSNLLYKDVWRSICTRYTAKNPQYQKDLREISKKIDMLKQELSNGLFKETEELDLQKDSTNYDVNHTNQYLEISKQHSANRDEFLKTCNLFDERSAEQILDIFNENNIEEISEKARSVKLNSQTQ